MANFVENKVSAEVTAHLFVPLDYAALIAQTTLAIESTNRSNAKTTKRTVDAAADAETTRNFEDAAADVAHLGKTAAMDSLAATVYWN